MAYVIGVDCGTSGTKTVLFREDGTVMASATIEYPMYQPKNGYAEQDPADWKDAMIRTIQTVVTKSGVSKEEIKGIGISGQMHGLVMLDKDNNVLRKSIIWCDQRTAAEVDEMNRVVGREKLMEITANPALTGWDCRKDPVGTEQRAGRVRKVPSHPAAQGLSASDPHRRVCHRGFGCVRNAAAGCGKPLLVRRTAAPAPDRQGTAGQGL